MSHQAVYFCVNLLVCFVKFTVSSAVHASTSCSMGISHVTHMTGLEPYLLMLVICLSFVLIDWGDGNAPMVRAVLFGLIFCDLEFGYRVEALALYFIATISRVNYWRSLSEPSYV